MGIFSTILYMAITLLLEYQVFTLILIVIIIYHAFKSDWRTLNRTILAYLLAIALVIGLPYGFIKSMYRAETTGIEQKVLEEVQKWIS